MTTTHGPGPLSHGKHCPSAPAACLAALAIILVAHRAPAEDAWNKRCLDALIKLGRTSNPAKPSEPPIKFPIDFTTLAPNDVEKAKQQILDATGSDLLVADHETLANPEIQAILARSPARLVLKTADFQAQIVNSTLGDHPKKLSLLLEIPVTAEEVANVFGKQSAVAAYLTTEHLSKIAAALHTLQSVDGPRPVTVRSGAAKQDLMAAIASAEPGEFFLIIDHNDDGVLKLPNGEQVPVSELNAALGKSSLKGVVLTCESSRYVKEAVDREVVTNRKVRFDEIACALSAVVKAYVEDVSCGAADNVLRELSKNLTSCFKANETKFKIGVAAVGGILTATIVELAPTSQASDPLNHPAAETNAPASPKTQKP
jgi:hypothetical protein